MAKFEVQANGSQILLFSLHFKSVQANLIQFIAVIVILG